MVRIIYNMRVERMVEKMLIIERCEECPHFNLQIVFTGDDELLPLEEDDCTVREYCVKLSRFFNDGDLPLPNWCPLPDHIGRRGSR